MKTVLVPTDFSDTAKNAAVFAIRLAEQVKASKIVLYNAYQVPVTIDPAMPVMQMVNIDEMKSISENGLHTLQAELMSLLPEGITIESYSEFAVLSTNIDEVCTRVGAQLIVMGITGTGSGFEEVLIGSNTISVVNRTKIPVLIIPAEVRYRTIKEILLVCDFRKVAESTPVQPILNILKDTEARLQVLNVSTENIQNREETLVQKEVLNKLLQPHLPEYHFINSDDFAESVNDFSDKNRVDLIITIPKKHGFFESIFKKSHTKQLAFHTRVPLLCIHEEEYER